MASHTIKMPDVGEGVTEAEIVTWHVKVGDVIEEDEDLVDVMTDKATVEIPSPVSGKIVKVMGEPGEMIAVGSEIIVIETDADAAKAETSQNVEGESDIKPAAKKDKTSQATPKPDKEPSSTSSKATEESAAKPETRQPPASVVSNPSGKKPLASPAVRQRALELDVDLTLVAGSGPAGRILREDLDDFVSSGGRAIARSGNSANGLSPKTGTRETKVIGLRRKIAKNMEAAWTVPMITYVEEIDVTEVESLRNTLNARKSEEQQKLTLIPFLALALIRALRQVTQANSHYFPEDDQLIEFDGVHLGIAAATDKGLVVPVLKHAEAMDIWTLAAEVKRLSEAARTGKAKREELTGSTITITSLGALGGVVTTPILNPPETAIIGVNKMMERPAFDGQGNVVPKLFMNLSSSFDHRIVDGYDAAVLIQKVREYLETPATLFIPEV